MVIYIKNMVCNRCKLIVQQEFDQLGWHISDLRLGEVTIHEDKLQPADLIILNLALQRSGLEIIDNKKAILVEHIKILILEMVHSPEPVFKENFSNFLSRKMGYNYTYLANMFLSKTGTCIEKYTIVQRIERVKALIQQEELNLTQISYLLCYSSVAHLSAQFKQVTGINASDYRKGRQPPRISIDKV